MDSPKNLLISLNNSNDILIEKHITVKAAAKVTGYNPQYLRRLLRAGRIAGRKVGQVWLIQIASMKDHLQQSEQSSDKRFGPKKVD